MNRSVANSVITHRFTIGTVLADAVRVYVRQFPRMLIAALVVLPMALGGYILSRLEVESPYYASVVGPVLTDMLSTIAALVAEAAAVMVVIHQLRGHPVSNRDLLISLPAVATVILGGLFVWLPDMIGRTTHYTLAAMFPESEWWAVALPYQAGLIIYVAVLIFWVMFTPVVVAERRGFRAALARSAQLGKGERWRVFVLLMILLVTGVAVAYGLELGVYVVLGTVYPWFDDLPSTLVVYGGYGLYMMLASTVSITMFHHLRLREEGMDTPRAVAAFD